MYPHLNTAYRADKNTLSFLEKYHLDGFLLIGIFILLCSSCVVLYSAKQDWSLLHRQLFRFGLAFMLMLFSAQLPPVFWRQISTPFYIISLCILLAVLLLGESSKGAQRWLNVGFFRFQPAEMLKLAVPLFLAHFLSRQTLPTDNKTSLISLVFIAFPALLVAKQPDLGTAILIGSGGLLCLFFSGITFRFIGILSSIFILSLPLLWYKLHDYQRQRVMTLFQPEADPLGTGYHIIQSKIAIGSGGLWGKGFLSGTQSQLDFLPERSTDFIFAVLGEEFGLMGALFLLCVYLFIIARGFFLSLRVQDVFSRLLSASLISALFVYVFVNIGMVTGLLPVVGVPLPLMSYGGSSMMTLLFSFGILMSVTSKKRSDLR